MIARGVGRSEDKARGGSVAHLALARKLAALYWRLMVLGMNDVEQGLTK